MALYSYIGKLWLRWLIGCQSEKKDAQKPLASITIYATFESRSAGAV